jgi:hypothetical protein
MAPENAWRCVLTFLLAVCFLIGSFNIPGIFVPFPNYERNLFGVLSSVMSGVAWALSTTFKSDQLTAGSNIIAAAFAAMSTGFFVPFSQIA